MFDDLAETCRRNVALGPLTWFGVGGPAEYLIEPTSEEQLAIVLRRCHENGVRVRMLGAGANVLVPDEGVAGVVVRLTADPFVGSEYDDKRPKSCGTAVSAVVVAGGGGDLPRLVRHAVRRGLAGLENLAGIPGTVGGGIRMNCGGRFGEIGTAVRRVRVIGADGEVRERDHDDLRFGYRRCDLDGDFVISASFELSEIDPGELVRRFRRVWMYKQNSQPPMGARSAGCIFRNPNGRSAGALIDKAGMKGASIGGARVSARHANFILVDRGGRAADVRKLMALIGDRVEDRFGIRLEPEVEVWS